MRDRDKPELACLARLVGTGQLNQSEARSLFMYLRGDAPAGSVLRDIGDTIGHDEKRDRGYAHRYANAFLAIVVANVNNPFPVPVAYDIHLLVLELGQAFAQHGIPHDALAMQIQARPLAHVVAEVLADTEIKLETPGVRVKFSADNPARPTLSFTFEVGFRFGPDLTVDVPMTLAFPLLIAP